MQFNVKKFELMHITKRKIPIHSDLHLKIIVSWSKQLSSVILACLPFAICLGALIDKISNKAE